MYYIYVINGEYGTTMLYMTLILHNFFPIPPDFRLTLDDYKLFPVF
jgi:hypothetical protein